MLTELSREALKEVRQHALERLREATTGAERRRWNLVRQSVDREIKRRRGLKKEDQWRASG